MTGGRRRDRESRGGPNQRSAQGNPAEWLRAAALQQADANRQGYQNHRRNQGSVCAGWGGQTLLFPPSGVIVRVLRADSGVAEGHEDVGQRRTSLGEARTMTLPPNPPKAGGHLNSPPSAPPKAQRQCGDCTACCTVMGVRSLNKSAGQPCAHLASSGCGIYSTRPEVCGAFTCLWLADTKGVLDDSHRPDRIGLVLTSDSQHPAGGIVARELREGAAAVEPNRRLLDYLRQFVGVRVQNAARTEPSPVKVTISAKAA